MATASREPPAAFSEAQKWGQSGDESATTTLGPGAYAFVPAKMAHYAWTDGDTTVQVHGIGPFVINYVNPADDPNRAGKK